MPINRTDPMFLRKTISVYWRVNMYLPSVDHLMIELDIRLLRAKSQYKVQHLLPKKATKLTQNLGDNIYSSYQDEIMETRDEFRAETQRWRAKWTGQENLPNTLQGTLNATNKDPQDFHSILHVCIYACIHSDSRTFLQHPI